MRMWFPSPGLFGSLVHHEADQQLENPRNASQRPSRLSILTIMTLIMWLLVIYGAACIVSTIFSGAHAELQFLVGDQWL
jgi:hypothetical protein